MSKIAVSKIAIIGILFSLILLVGLGSIETQAKEVVVLYGTSWCPYCKNAREYLRAHRIKFADYDIEASQVARKRFETLRGKAIPLIFVGPIRIDGFDRKELENALQQRGLLTSY